MDTVLSGSTVYEERQSFWLMHVIFIIVAAGLVSTAILTGAASDRIPLAEALSLTFALLVAAVVVWGFSRMKVTVTTTGIKFGFRLWSRSAALADVAVGDVVKIPFLYGIGLHYVGGTWVYNARLGKGVILLIRGKRYLVGSDNPERLQGALLQLVPRRVKS